jgi:hypothetical protein
MVQERLDAAGELFENSGQVRQFAIAQARQLLTAAGVKDPGPLTPAEYTGLLIPEGATRLPDIHVGDLSRDELLDLFRSLSTRKWKEYRGNNPPVERFEHPFITDDSSRVQGGIEAMIQNPNFSILSEPNTVSLALIHLKDLKFADLKRPLKEVYKIAIDDLGLDLCPPEVGPRLMMDPRFRSRLRIDYSKPSSLWLGMQPVDGETIYYSGRTGFASVGAMGDISHDYNDDFIFAIRDTK